MSSGGGGNSPPGSQADDSEKDYLRAFLDSMQKIDTRPSFTADLIRGGAGGSTATGKKKDSALDDAGGRGEIMEQNADIDSDLESELSDIEKAERAAELQGALTGKGSWASVGRSDRPTARGPSAAYAMAFDFPPSCPRRLH